MGKEIGEMGKYMDKLVDFVIMYGPKLIGAIVVLVIGLFLVKIITNTIARVLENRNVDPSLRPFVGSLIKTTLKILLFISVLSIVGIEMTSFIAILGAAGLAVGMALSGTLQNFAGGVMILSFKPFGVGDYIEAQGYAGTVKEIQIFNTIIKTPDNKTIIIPNGGLSTGSMINYSTEPTRRVDWTFGIGYGDDIDKAKEVLIELLNSNDKILKDPAIFVEVGELADSSVNFTVRAWVKSADYWDVYFYMPENVYKTFAAKNLSIPFPQMDIHLDK